MTASKKPRVERIIGHLPPRWDRSVIFFANLRSLFFGNDAQCEWLCTEIKGISTYGNRLVPLLDLMYAGEANALVVEEAPDPVLMKYYEHDLGLTLPEIHVIPHEEYLQLSETRNKHYTRLNDWPAKWVEGYVTDPYLAEVTQQLRKQSVTCPRGSMAGNNKLLLHQFLKQAGLPVFCTEIVERPDDIPAALKILSTKGYTHAAIKSQIGASGIGIMKTSCTEPMLNEIPASMFYEGAVMVQGWLDANLPEIDAVGSPSVQLFLQEDSIYLYDITEQLLSGDHLHQGNVAPPPYLDEIPKLKDTLLGQAEQAAGWLYETGYRGTASVDFIVVRRAGVLECYACEINARVTGATYPSMLARHFAPGEAWLMRNLQAHQPVKGEDILFALDLAGLLYRPGQLRGVLPINFNMNEAGLEFKGQFLCIAPTVDACYDLLKEADELDTTEWTHARD